jgi:hypothetical protein
MTTAPKFNDIVARLAVALDEPATEFGENLRVMRMMAPDTDDPRVGERRTDHDNLG